MQTVPTFNIYAKKMLHFGAQRGKEVDFPRSGSDSGSFYALWSVGRF